MQLWESVLARTATPQLQPTVTTSSSPGPAPSAAASPAPTASPASTGSPATAPDALYRAADRLTAAARPLYAQLFLPVSQAPGGEAARIWKHKGCVMQIGKVHACSS